MEHMLCTLNFAPHFCEVRSNGKGMEHMLCTLNFAPHFCEVRSNGKGVIEFDREQRGLAP
jgi:hypothetical protein